MSLAILKKRKQETPPQEEQNIVKTRTTTETELPSPNIPPCLSLISSFDSQTICLELGQYKEEVINYFENFENFNMVKYCKRIGKVSRNGIAIDLLYEKDIYKAHAVLKLVYAEKSDNLLYEYIAGFKKINKYTNVYPCFTQTYGIFKINDTNYTNLKNLLNIPTTTTFDVKMLNLEKYPKINIHYICKNPKEYCILIQYFPNFMLIGNELEASLPLARKEMPGIIYQLYFGLERIKDIFTHYDFHGGNAGFYKPFSNKYLIMNYHLDNNTIISFPTIYIAKIIDYGRSHINISVRDRVVTTRKIMSLVETLPDCEPGRGFDKGFGIIRGIPNETADAPNSKFHWINPLVKNNSHDLRLLFLYSKELLDSFGSYDKFFKGINYKTFNGTPELLGSFDKTTRIIKNISDVRECFEEFIPFWVNLQKIEEQYIKSGLTKAGEIHIYEDGRPYETILV